MERISRMLRSGLAMMLVLCMIISACPIAAFAADNEIKYVSIGDSMANGYGFAGYHQDSNDRTKYDFKYGTGMYGAGAYPNQFEDYLTGLGYDVTHTKLATSAMLAEDLLYLLGGREYFDDGWGGYQDYVGTYSDAEISAHVQEAVKEADVITMGIGNAAFGAFLMHKLTDALGVFGAELTEDEKVNFEDAISILELDAEQYALVMKVYKSLETMLVNQVPADLAAQYNLGDVVDLLAYTTASYVVNYKALIEQMLEMNPDVEIVLVGLLNTTYGMNITDASGNVVMPFGDVMDSLFATLNAYMAGLPAALQAMGVGENAKLYYASQPNPKFICQEFENLLNNEWVAADSRLDGALIRQRNIDAFNGDLAYMIGMAVTGEPLAQISLADVEGYQGAAWDVGQSPDKQLSVAIYLAIEEAVAKSTNTMDIPLSGLVKIAGDLSSVFTALGIPPVTSPEASRQWLLNGLTTEETQGMCKIYGLFKVGNGMSVHPTPAGHDEIAASVIAAYKNHTVQDETIKNVQYVLGELKGFMEEYGPDAAAQLLAIWNENGYQAIVDETVAELTKTIEARYNDYKDNVIPALTETAEELTAQKAELTAQLTTLNAQLAAKKAELEKVISEQEIGSVHTPDISIDTVLGNNQQTQVPENDCEGPGNVADELAAAAADLEHAIAVIEALIADVQADIDDMVALATEIAEAIAELEKTMADVAAAAEDLKEAFDAVYAVLTDADAEATSQSFITVFNTAREAAQAAVEALELVTETAAEDITAIDESINILVEGVEALYAEFDAENKEAALLKVLSVLPEDVLMGAGYVGGAAYKIIAELDLDIEDVLKNLDSQKAEALKAFNDKKNEITAKLTGDLKALEAQYAPQIQAAQENLKAEQAKVEQEIKAQFAAYEQAAAAEIENLKAAAQVELDKLNAELAGYQKDLENAAADAVAGIQAQIDRVTGDIAEIEEDLACAIEHVNTELETIHDQIVSDVTDAYNEAIAELQKIHDDLVNQFNTAVENLQAAADKAIQDLENLYNETIENLEQAAKDAINDLITEAEKAIDALEDLAEGVKESVKETLEQIRDQLIDSINEAVENAIDALVEKAKEILTDVNDAVTDAITNAANEILNAIRDDIKNVQEAIEDILNGALEGAENLKDALVDLGIDGIDTLVDELTKLINDLIHEATHADLTVDDDFLYVAIGDDTALPEGYAELLEKAIEDETGADITLKNEAKAGNTIAKERENLSDVADAGLITIGFGNVNMLNAAVNAALSDTPVSYDWAELVGEDLVPYVQDALADVYAEIDATVETPEIAAVAKAAVESIAYSSVQYAVELPQLIAEIRAINTDAVIVIVGQYNPMDNAVLDLSMMGGSTLDLSEYIDYFVKGVAAHGIAYSIISGDAIFVEAPEVTTENTDTEWSMIDLGKMAMNGFKTLNPNAAGDDYIARQIADALNITYEPSGLLGDVNDDGVVDGRDVIRLAKYVAEYDNIVINSKNSEVTGNDVIDGRDVIRLAKFVAEYEGVTLG